MRRVLKLKPGRFGMKNYTSMRIKKARMDNNINNGMVSAGLYFFLCFILFVLVHGCVRLDGV